MKAQDLVQAVYRAEKELSAELAEMVAKKINQLSADTGLCIGSISIDLYEVTTHESIDREYATKHVLINTWLPQKIYTGD